MLRFEHIYPNRIIRKDDPIMGAQWYPNCAHVEIVNEGTVIGKPSPLVKFPGVYKFGQPGTCIFPVSPNNGQISSRNGEG